jgi:uncharacterized protein (TIGR03437 family)
MYLRRKTLAALAIFPGLGVAQPPTAYSIRTLAGAPRALGDNGPATAALLWSPTSVSVDAAGNLYIADSGNARIRKVTPGGVITTIAGTIAGYAGDAGPAAAAELSFPTRAAMGPGGDLFIADAANNRIRRISPSGVITTFAGNGQPGFTGDDGLAGNAELNSPRDIAIDSAGNVYVADSNNYRIRRITPQGRITTVAGLGVYGFFGDQGPALQATFSLPHGVALDAAGDIYVADTSNNRIRKVGTDGTVTTVAGTNSAGYTADGVNAALAQLNAPSSVAVDATGNIYIADTGNNRVRRIGTQGTIVTIAGAGAGGFGGDGGAATSALLSGPQGVVVDAAGNVYIADTGNHRVRKVSPQGVITTVAGANPAGGDNGPATSARFFQPSGVALDASGNLYISDTLNNRVRRVSKTGVIVTIAGVGSAGYSGDSGAAIQSQLNNPQGLAFDGAGNLYVADTGNNVIRRITPGGQIATVVGTGDLGNGGDFGPAASAQLFNPNAVAFDRAGNMYIADSANNRIRIVDASGTIRNLAGDPAGQPGYAGDNGPPQSARFRYPRGLAVDDSGNIYVSDYFNCVVRRINASSNTITAFAGRAQSCGYGGDGGAATQAQLNLPAGLAFDRLRNLYIADYVNNLIRVVSAAGVVRTIAGNGQPAFAGDGGPATSGSVSGPRDLAVDADGNIDFSDQDNSAVRQLAPQTIAITTVVNAASQIGGPVSPGEIISIMGAQLGPSGGQAAPTANGSFPTNSGGVRVFFDGIAAPLLYASSNQINAIVPYELAGRTTSQMQVENGGVRSTPFTVTLRDAAPGIFTIGGSGAGQGAIVNQDGTVNSAQNPAARGAAISIYATGEGAAPKVTVQIQGLAAEVLFAGSAQAQGLLQVNVRLPDGVIPSDRVPVQLSVGSFAAQPGVTVAVR